MAKIPDDVKAQADEVIAELRAKEAWNKAFGIPVNPEIDRAQQTSKEFEHSSAADNIRAVNAEPEHDRDDDLDR